MPTSTRAALGNQSLDHCSYIIKICGRLDERWSTWFNGITITCEQDPSGISITALHCPPIDQARLRGMLNRIWDVNLNLISVVALGVGRPQTENAQAEEPDSPRLG